MRYLEKSKEIKKTIRRWTQKDRKYRDFSSKLTELNAVKNRH